MGVFLIANINQPEQEYAKLIVARIRSLCDGKRISINKLAEMSGVSQKTLDSLINGKSLNPTIRTLHKVALAFSMTVAEFLDFKELNDYSFEDKKEEE